MESSEPPPPPSVAPLSEAETAKTRRYLYAIEHLNEKATVSDIKRLADIIEKLEDKTITGLQREGLRLQGRSLTEKPNGQKVLKVVKTGVTIAAAAVACYGGYGLLQTLSAGPASLVVLGKEIPSLAGMSSYISSIVTSALEIVGSTGVGILAHKFNPFPIIRRIDQAGGKSIEVAGRIGPKSK